MKKKIQKKVLKKKGGAKKAPRKAIIKVKKQKLDPKIAKKVKDFKARTDRLLAKGKERGFVTYDEILKEFPHIEEDIVFLDDLYSRLSLFFFFLLSFVSFFCLGGGFFRGGGKIEGRGEKGSPKKTPPEKEKNSAIEV